MFAYRLKMLARRIVTRGVSFWITILGLTVGLTAAAFIAMYVINEAGYDRGFPGFRDIHRVEMVFRSDGRPDRATALSPGPLRDAMRADFPEVAASARIFSRDEAVTRGRDVFTEEVSYVDAEFLKVFELPFARGDAANALRNPNAIVLSESAARKYFGDEDPIGRTLTLRGDTDYFVSAVLRDPPQNTHLREALNFLMLFDERRWTYTPDSYTSWRGATAYTYVRLREGIGPERLAPRFRAFLDKNVTVPPSLPYHGRKGSTHMSMSLMPLADIRLHSKSEYQLSDLETDTYGRVVMLLAACFIVLGASAINFTIIAMADAYERAREISLHMVHGARRAQIIGGFVFESLVIVLACFLVSMLILYAALAGRGEGMEQFAMLEGSPARLLFVAAPIVALVLVLSSFVPAAHLSSLRPARFLRSGHGSRTNLKWLIWILLPTQAAIAIGLTISAWILSAQYRYSMNPDANLRMDKVAVIRLPRSEPPSRLAAMVERIRIQPGIRVAGLGELAPGNDRISSALVTVPAEQGLVQYSVNKIAAGPGYFEALQVRPLAGRLLDRARPADMLSDAGEGAAQAPVSILVNRKFAEQLGYTPEKAIGLRLDQISTLPGRSGTVVGVIPDIKWDGVQQEVVATLSYFNPEEAKTILLDYGDRDYGTAVEALARVWRDQYPDLPFDAVALPDHWGARLWEQERALYVLTAFALLAIGLAALGLYASSLYTVRQSRREIAIRKVFGAARSNIVALFLRKFSAPIVLAAVVAVAATWWLTYRWLLGFAYRIELTIWPFLLTAIGALLLSWLVVIGQIMESTRVRPASVLREE